MPHGYSELGVATLDKDSRRDAFGRVTAYSSCMVRAFPRLIWLLLERTNTKPKNATINIGKSRIIHISDGLHGPGWLRGLGLVGVCTSITMDIPST
jgi:hypothetical protein